MAQLSKERLEEIVSDPTINQGSAFAEMARRLLAVEGQLAELAAQDPVFEIEVSGNHWLNAGPVDDSDFTSLPDGINKLYTRAAPQPATVAASTEYLPCDVRVGESVTIKKGNDVSVLLEVLRVQSGDKLGKFELVIDLAGQTVAQPVQVPDEVLRQLLPDVEKADFWFEHEGNTFFEGVKFNDAVFEACRAAILQTHSEDVLGMVNAPVIAAPQEPTK